MAQVTLHPEIKGISGKVGNMIFKTYQNGKVFAYKAPNYERRKALTAREQASRELMAKRHRRVIELMQSGMSRKEAWDQAKQEIPQ